MMELVVVTGGVRSGKSRWAQDEALARGGEEVTVIATAEAVDDEMRDRIEAHRRDRPAGWHTIEAPERAGEAILAAGTDTVMLDCVTVLTGMAIGRAGAKSEAAALDATAAEIDGILEARAAARRCAHRRDQRSGVERASAHGAGALVPGRAGYRQSALWLPPRTRWCSWSPGWRRG